MPGVNGYFELMNKENDAYVRLFPPKSGGEDINLGELTEYLERNHILLPNLGDLKKAVDQREQMEILLMPLKLLPTNEEMRLIISEDKMTATVRFYPAYAGGSLLNQNDIVTTLAHNGIIVGIQKEQIELFLKQRAYCTDYIFAQGIEPIDGTDAVIEYYFSVDHDCKPTLKDDGTVDFHDLNNISHVKKGDLLAKLTKEVEGKPGKTITGVPLPPRKVKRDKLRFGRNITISEDKLTLISDVDGHVELVDDKVFVSDVYKVGVDVDVSTGDIEYEGNVEVTGNVRSGFTIRAKGDIIVGGVVEAATLISGRDIVLKRGIQGMGKGYLEAQNNIIAKFIENARVKSLGSITTEAILHSHVTAKDQVMITGKKGFVTGGSVSATNLIEAKTIGSEMGTETMISVGSDPDKKELFYALQVEVENLQKNLDQLKPMAMMASKVLGSGECIDDKKKQQLRKIMKSYQHISDSMSRKYDEIKELEDYIDNTNSARIRITDKVFPGVKFVISECRYVVKDIQQHCQLRKEDGDIKIGGL